MTTQDIVIIIGVTTTSVVTIVNTIGLFWGKSPINKKINRANVRLLQAEDSRYNVARNITGRLEEAKRKLETVEENTNGNLTKALERITQIENALAKALAANDSKEKDKIIVDDMNSK